MNKIITIILVVGLSPQLTVAQETDPIRTQTEETILKVEKPNYRRSQIKWLNKEGFDTDSYEWNDPNINLLLDKSLKQRSWGDISGITGGTLVAINLLSNFVLGPILHSLSDDHDKGEFKPSNQLYYIGGTMIAASFALNLSALGKLSKAKNMRNLK